MIVTQLEARVSPENWDAMTAAYRAAIDKVPASIVQTYLLQDTADTEVWRVFTVWHSREALQAYRDSVETPEGVAMFRAAGVEPELTILSVMEHAAGS